ATATSFRVLTAELRSTNRRLRTIEHHRIPALEDALRVLNLRLEELEREERVVSRWAMKRDRARYGDAQTFNV
ncbi:MAG: V-type ATP synthase subunit D, partial [Acidimicrobiales bacterium]